MANFPETGDRDALSKPSSTAVSASQSLQLTPNSLHQTPAGWATWITGKGQKRAEVGIYASLAARLQAYAYQEDINPEERVGIQPV